MNHSVIMFGGEMNPRIAATSSRSVRLIEQFCRDHGEELALLAKQIGAVFADGGVLLLAGHGPLQPLAQLIAGHFTYRLNFDRPTLPAVALGSDPVLAAAMAGSDQQEQMLVRHYRALCGRARQHLLLFANGSENQALRLLRDEVLEGGHSVTVMTADRQREPLCSDGVEICLSLGTGETPRLLEMALFAGHLLCELVESELFGI